MSAKLREASFRGVPFEVVSTTVKVGRRVVVFEYPQRDIPFVEDLGKSARTITIEAFVSGADYIAKMKNIMEAMEKPGSGKLIDPWLGQMNVTPKSASSPTFNSLRYAKVHLEFVETGELKYPNSLLDTRRLCQKAADSLLEKGEDWFGNIFKSSGAPDVITSSVGENVKNLFSGFEIHSIADAFDMAEGLSSFADDVMTLVEGDSRMFAERLIGTLGLGDYVSTVRNWRDVSDRISAYLKSDELHQNLGSPAQLSNTSRTVIERNTSAVQSLVRTVMISNLVGAASEIGTENDRISAKSAVQTPAYDDLIDQRNDILSIIDDEMFLTQSDEVFEALKEARSAVYKDLTEKAENSARLVDFTPPSVMPAIVLSYDYYGEASRDTEIIERNKIRHGGFVPAQKLRLMNE